MLNDLPAERAVLAGIYRYGAETYYDVADIIDESSFTDESNAVIFSCMKHVLETDDTVSLDIPTMLSAAKEMGLETFFNTQEVQHLSSITKYPVFSQPEYFCNRLIAFYFEILLLCKLKLVIHHSCYFKLLDFSSELSDISC